MGEKVEVYRSAKQEGRRASRPSGHIHPQPAPDLAHEARHARVHEPAVERNPEQFGIRFFRVRPRSHPNFIQFKCQADDVKDADDFDFVEGFQSAAVHNILHAEQYEQDRIVTMQERNLDDAGQGQRSKDGDRENAAHRLMVSKMEKLNESFQNGCAPSDAAFFQKGL